MFFKKVLWRLSVVFAVLVLNACFEGRQSEADRQEILKKALVDLNQKAHALALEKILPLALDGYAPAQYELAMMYRRGIGLKLDEVAMFRWLHAADGQGFTKAQYELAAAYEALGNDFLLSMLLKVGDCQIILHDPDQMLSETSQSLRNKVLEECREIIRNVEQGYLDLKPAPLTKNGTTPVSDSNVLDSEKLNRKIVARYEVAANAGEINAQFRLATIFANGERNQTADATKSFTWLEKAALGGHAEAQKKLAFKLLDGDGVPKDEPRAQALFSVLGSAHPDAQLALATMYARGGGIPVDVTKAHDILTVLAENTLNDENIRCRANYELALILKAQGNSPVLELNQAALQIADASLMLSYIYGLGEGETPDAPRALWSLLDAIDSANFIATPLKDEAHQILTALKSLLAANQTLSSGDATTVPSVNTAVLPSATRPLALFEALKEPWLQYQDKQLVRPPPIFLREFDEIIQTQLTRSEVRVALEDMPKLYTLVRVVPYFENGKQIGFKLISIKEGSIFAKMGLKHSDVLLKVNGMTLDLQSAMNFSANVSAAIPERFELIISRKKLSKLLLVNVVP